MANETTPLTNSSRGRYVLPSLADSVQMDPSAPGTVVRYALAIEAAFNIFGATAMMLFPSKLLSLAVTEPSQVAPAASSLFQWVAALIYGLTPPLLLCIPNTRGAIESRQTVYYTLLAGEGFLIPVFLYQAFGTRTGSGFTKKALIVCSSVLVFPSIWRLVVLLGKREWLGRYKDGRKEA